MKVGDVVTFSPELVAQGLPARALITQHAIGAGATAYGLQPETERQGDQRFVDDQRADYLRRANAVSTPDEPIDPEWDGIKL